MQLLYPLAPLPLPLCHGGTWLAAPHEHLRFVTLCDRSCWLQKDPDRHPPLHPALSIAKFLQAQVKWCN